LTEYNTHVTFTKVILSTTSTNGGSMPTCRDCNNTGVIETGNNDIPCHCPAGNTAVFNCTGEGQLTGAEIKHLNDLPQMPTKFGVRTEFGHTFDWYEGPGCWHSTSGQHVVVVPPHAQHQSWLVIVPDIRSVEEITGRSAEARAFIIAETYTRQLKSVA
jgi:hypothetical protein